MKHIALLLLLASLATAAIAEDTEQARSYTPPATMVIPMVSLVGGFIPESKTPFVSPMLQARFSHRFTDFQKTPELTLNAEGRIAPVEMQMGASFSAKLFNFATLSAGGDVSTSWGLHIGPLDLDLIGSYDYAKKRYEYFSPLTHWVYDLWAQCAISYDIGSELSDGKHHVLLNVSYRTQYSAMTGVDDGEMWMNMGMGEQVNGWTYRATAGFSYQFPFKFLKSAGLSASLSGYYSDAPFAARYKDYDGDFVDISVTATAMASIGYKDIFMLLVPVSGKRNLDCDDDDLRPLSKPDGRKWGLDVIMLTYTHLF